MNVTFFVHFPVIRLILFDTALDRKGVPFVKLAERKIVVDDNVAVKQIVQVIVNLNGSD